MLQHNISLPPLRIENSAVSNYDFYNTSTTHNNNHGVLEDFTFAESNSNHYNNTVGDQVIHVGNYDEPLIVSNNYMNQVSYNQII